jgi:hypothetical protein
MKRMNWMVVLGLTAGMLAVDFVEAAPVPFTHSYTGDALPQDPLTVPQWTKVLDSDEAGPNTTESASGGILTVFTASVPDFIEYRQDGGGAWNPTALGSTVETRLKVDFNSEGASYAGDLVILTGARGWFMRFGTGSINEVLGGGTLEMDTSSAFHTYRFTTTEAANAPLNLYVDGSTTPAITFAGVDTGSNRLGFGDATTSLEGGQIQWDYIDWTNAGAFAPVPEPSTLALMALGGTALLRTRRARRR